MTDTPAPLNLAAIKARPCPFCGGPAQTMFYNGTIEAGCAGSHECAGTDVLVPVAAWNRRAASPSDIAALVAEVERLRDALKVELDYHDAHEAQADAMDMLGPARHHRERADAIRAALKGTDNA